MNQPSKFPKFCQLNGETITFDGSGQVDSDPPTIKLKKKRFKMTAYSGKPMEYFGLKIIYDLKGMKFAQTMPILQQHNHEKIVALADKAVLNEQGLHLEGNMYATSAAKEVCDLAESDPPFPWQASMGVHNNDAVFYDEGESCQVNGHQFDGPGIVVTDSFVKESSFVPLGADDSTRSLVFADDTSGAVNLRRCSMSETKPVDTPDPLVVERKRIADITAAFPKDPAFANKHIGLGSSVLEARAAYSEELEKKIMALEARPQNDPVPGRSSQQSPDVGSEWEQAVAAETQELERRGFIGDVKFEALKRADRKHPGLRDQYLEQYNETMRPRLTAARMNVRKG